MVKVLLIEDDPDGRQSVKAVIEDMGYEVTDVDRGEAGVSCAMGQAFDVVLCDLVLPDIDGIQVLERVRKTDSEVPFIIMTAYGTVSNAVQALKAGAYDYITKPLDLDDIQSKVGKAAEMRFLRARVANLEESFQSLYSSNSIVAEDPAMLSVIEQVRTLADTDVTVLIQGESGTGKELIARALHVDGRRGNGPFVAVNCGAFTESLLESELFGHEKGAFTGASARRKGAFERADGGTLFLDEVGSSPASVQVKLLRVLEEREFMRVGGEKMIKADVRLLSASNRSLDEMVEDGEFREDLLYRLKVAALTVPPLRERLEDLGPLVSHFLKEANREHGRTITGITDEGHQLLRRHAWPGNVRELRNVIESSVVMAAGTVLDASDIRIEQGVSASPLFTVPDEMSMDDLEREILLQLLDRNRGNKTLVADKLGISRRTIQRKIKEYGLPY